MGRRDHILGYQQYSVMDGMRPVWHSLPYRLVIYLVDGQRRASELTKEQIVVYDLSQLVVVGRWHPSPLRVIESAERDTLPETEHQIQVVSKRPGLQSAFQSDFIQRFEQVFLRLSCGLHRRRH